MGSPCSPCSPCREHEGNTLADEARPVVRADGHVPKATVALVAPRGHVDVLGKLSRSASAEPGNAMPTYKAGSSSL